MSHTPLLPENKMCTAENQKKNSQKLHVCSSFVVYNFVANREIATSGHRFKESTECVGR